MVTESGAGCTSGACSPVQNTAFPGRACSRKGAPPNPDPDQQSMPHRKRAQSRLQQAGPRTGAGAGRRTLSSEYLGAGAMVVGRASYCLSMLLCAATNFCPTIDYCKNFFVFLRFDEQTKLLVEIDRVSARTSSTLTIANASTSSSSLAAAFAAR